jgi:predicted metal-dependent enzyme (double-stranded beta helix superfamily)
MTRPDLHQDLGVDHHVDGSVELTLLERDPQERTHGRELSEPELLELVRDLAFRQDGWQHLVEHDPVERRYHELSRDDDVSVWLVCWSGKQDAGFHDHDRSPGAVAVVAGRLHEERLSLGGRSHTRTATAGESFTFSAADVHRISNAPDEFAVTIHAHSPPLPRIGAYDLLPDGGLRRRSMFRRRRTPPGLRALTRELS